MTKANKQIVKELVKIARELIEPKSITASKANMLNLYKGLRKVVDVEFSSGIIYPTERMGLGDYNKARKAIAMRLKWLGFELVDKWTGGQLWRNEEMGGIDINIFAASLPRGQWSFSIDAA